MCPSLPSHGAGAPIRSRWGSIHARCAGCQAPIGLRGHSEHRRAVSGISGTSAEVPCQRGEAGVRVTQSAGWGCRGSMERQITMPHGGTRRAWGARGKHGGGTWGARGEHGGHNRSMESMREPISLDHAACSPASSSPLRPLRRASEQPAHAGVARGALELWLQAAWPFMACPCPAHVLLMSPEMPSYSS